MGVYAGPVQDLIDELGRLPGVGPKSAQRIAFHLLKLPKQDALRLARSITEVKDRVAFCTRCFNIAEGDECGICADDRRTPTSGPKSQNSSELGPHGPMSPISQKLSLSRRWMRSIGKPTSSTHSATASSSSTWQVTQMRSPSRPSVSVENSQAQRMASALK